METTIQQYKGPPPGGSTQQNSGQVQIETKIDPKTGIAYPFNSIDNYISRFSLG